MFEGDVMMSKIPKKKEHLPTPVPTPVENNQYQLTEHGTTSLLLGD